MVRKAAKMEENGAPSPRKSLFGDFETYKRRRILDLGCGVVVFFPDSFVERDGHSHTDTYTQRACDTAILPTQSFFSHD
jgi:hypothetical protein